MIGTTLSVALLSIVATGAVMGAVVGLAGLVLLYFAAGDATQLAVSSVWNALTEFTLSAVPLFVFLGEIMLLSGLSDRTFRGLAPLFRKVPGKLLHVNIVFATLFASVSGSSTSTAAAIGRIGMKELEQRGYHLPTVAASLAAGGTLGLLIPPSLSFVIYGATQNVSIGRLFIAGIVPGLLLAAMFMVFIAVLSRVRRGHIPPADDVPVRLPQLLLGLLNIWPLIALMASVIGTIYFGIATVTEAAAIGVFFAILLGFTAGDLTLRKLWRAFTDGCAVYSAIGLMFVGSLILSQAISILGVPFEIIQSIQALGLDPLEVYLLICLMYLLLGCFFDAISLLLMTLPVVFPLITALGYDPIWFGVIVTILVEVGMLTPPVGGNLFVLVAVSGNRLSIAQLAAATVPYWVIMLLAVALFTWQPAIVTWLPNQLF